MPSAHARLGRINECASRQPRCRYPSRTGCPARRRYFPCARGPPRHGGARRPLVCKGTASEPKRGALVGAAHHEVAYVLKRTSHRLGLSRWTGPGLGRHAFASWAVRFAGYTSGQVTEALGRPNERRPPVRPQRSLRARRSGPPGSGRYDVDRRRPNTGLGSLGPPGGDTYSQWRVVGHPMSSARSSACFHFRKRR